MSTWKRVRIALVTALVAGWAGATLTTVAAQAAGSSEIFGAAATLSQKEDAPPDCKRNPDDPRCRKKPY